MELKKINLDGIDYQAEESVIKALQKADARAKKAEEDACTAKKELDKAIADAEKAKEELEKKLSEVEAEKDTAKDKADGLEKELEELKKTSMDSTKLDAAVKARIELLHNAEKAKVEVKEDMSEMDIKKAVVLSTFPNANFDGKDDVYIQARYDATVEMLCEKNDAQTRAATSDLPPENHADADDARKRMIERMKNHGKED